jgi:urease accessory protein
MTQPAIDNYPATMHASGRQAGKLDLALERIGEMTRPLRAEVRPPLQLSRARYDIAGQPETVAFTLVHLGGILDGDRYDLCVEVGPGASAQITTAAATQVYRMPHGDARQEITLRLAANSWLAWLPEPLILFAGARFTQITYIEIAAGARLGLLDVLVPGRLARGEVGQFERYEARLEVCTPNGRCLVAERALLEPQRRAILAPGMLGRTPVLGSLYILDDTLDAERCCAWVNQRDDRALGATSLPNGSGLLVRALGDAPSAVHTKLRGLWSRFEECAGLEAV